MNLSPFKQISISILSYNRKDSLRFSLSKIYELGQIWNEVIVVDNASTDGSTDMVLEEFPQVKLIALKENQGISASTYGCMQAKGEWVLALDDDSYPVIETFEPLFSVIGSGIKAAVIALSVRKDWKPNIVNVQGSMLFTEGFGFSGAGVIFNTEALRSIGGYCDKLFLFTNELDWTARAILQNWKIIKSSFCCVVHKSQEKAKVKRSVQKRYAYYYCRNTFIWLLRYAPREEILILVKKYLNNVFAYTFMHGTTVYLRALLNGLKILKTNEVPSAFLKKEQYELVKANLKAPFSYLS